MSFTVLEADQRSPEWFKARAGRLTGSVAAEMMATRKDSTEAAARRDLRTRLVLERIVGEPLEDDYQNFDMRRGIELEPEAIGAYEALTGRIVWRTGFLAHEELPIGCSLDGHFGEFEGLLELKCPRSANHLRYLRTRGLPAEHRWQVIHNLFVTGAQWAEFVSYDPKFPEPLRLFIHRYERVQSEIDSYEMLLRQFLREVDAEFAEVSRMAMVAVA